MSFIEQTSAVIGVHKRFMQLMDWFQTNTDMWLKQVEKQIAIATDHKIQRVFQIHFSSPKEAVRSSTFSITLPDVSQLHPALKNSIAKIKYPKLMFIFICDNGILENLPYIATAVLNPK